MGWCKLGIVDERVIGGHPQHRRMRSPKDLEDTRKGQTRHWISPKTSRRHRNVKGTHPSHIVRSRYG
jgi:hypothetical protein